MRRIPIEKLTWVRDWHRESFSRSALTILSILDHHKDENGCRARFRILNRVAKMPVFRGAPAKRVVHEFYEFHRTKDIVLASPSDLLELIGKVEAIRTSRLTPQDARSVKRVIDFVSSLFSYRDFYQKRGLVEVRTVSAKRKGAVCCHVFQWVEAKQPQGEPWSLWRYLKELSDSPQTEVRRCPYCNSDLVYALKVGSNGQFRFSESAFDHFYPKDRYPYLAVSLCNLVPVCTRCNQAKGDRVNVGKKEIHNPYEDDFHSDVTFSWGDNLKAALKDALPNGLIRPKADVQASHKNWSDFALGLFAPQDLYAQMYQGKIRSIPGKLRKAYSLWQSDVASLLAKKAGSGFCGPLGSVEWKRLILGSELDPDKINAESIGKLTLDLVNELDGGA